MIKKIFGYLLLCIAAFLGLVAISQLKDIQNDIITIFRYFTSSSVDDYTLGSAIGVLFVDIIFILIIISLFVLGKKFIKKEKSPIK